MKWHYAEEGRTEGPVTDEQIKQLKLDGRLTADSLVWCDGMVDWKPYGQVFNATESSSDGMTEQGQLVSCTVCGKGFQKNEVISFDDRFVCSACKPVFVQRLKEGVPLNSGTVAKDGKNLVMGLGALLPDRCVKCNAPSTHRLRRKLLWHAVWLYLFVFINIVIYAIIAACIRKKAEITIGLCEKHFNARKRDIWIAWSCILGGIGMLIGGAMIHVISTPLVLIFIVLIICGGIYGITRGRIIFASKIDKEYIRIKGAGKEFLDSLPEFLK